MTSQLILYTEVLRRSDRSYMLHNVLFARKQILTTQDKNNEIWVMYRKRLNRSAGPCLTVYQQGVAACVGSVRIQGQGVAVI